MGMMVDETIPLHIKLGGGFKAKTQGQCKGVRIQIADLRVEIDAMVFDLDGIDILLGMT